jgi:hypothetical protein
LCDILYNVIVPLICAIIGGGMTLWGVLITIRREKKAAHEQKVEEYKPFLFSLNENAKVNLDEMVFFTFGRGIESDAPAFISVEGRIKNIGQKACILDRIETSNCTYIPFDGNILDSGRVCQLLIYAETDLEAKWTLFVRDILGNEYNYELLNVAEQSFAIKNEVIYHDKKRIK